MAGGMGGGWGKRGSGVPLAERARAGLPVDPPDTGPPCPARHCWVADAADGRGVKRPGLLVEWREVEGRWQGRVIYAGLLRAGTWAVVEEWLPAELLTPS